MFSRRFLNAPCRLLLRLLNATPNYRFRARARTVTALIAAAAFVHGMTSVTRNVAHCEPIGVGIVYPWLP